MTLAITLIGGPTALIGKSITVIATPASTGCTTSRSAPCRIHMLHRWRIR